MFALRVLLVAAVLPWLELIRASFTGNTRSSILYIIYIYIYCVPT